MTETPDRYIHPKEILETGTPVKHTVNGVEMMWVVDFDLQIATLGHRIMYERKDWLGFPIPNRDLFFQFLKVEQSRATEGIEKSLQTWLNTEIAAKVLPELIRYYVESNGKLPDHEVKAALYRETLSYADGLIEQARSSTTFSDTQTMATHISTLRGMENLMSKTKTLLKMQESNFQQLIQDLRLFDTALSNAPKTNASDCSTASDCISVIDETPRLSLHEIKNLMYRSPTHAPLNISASTTKPSDAEATVSNPLADLALCETNEWFNWLKTSPTVAKSSSDQ
jgi:hypothetical protein